MLDDLVNDLTKGINNFPNNIVDAMQLNQSYRFEKILKQHMYKMVTQETNIIRENYLRRMWMAKAEVETT